MPYLECRDCGSPFDGAADDSLTRTCPECFGEIAVYSVKPRAPATHGEEESRRVLLLSRRLGADPSAPAAARQSLGDLRGILGDDAALDSLRLLVSELVTNAVKHSGAGPIGLDVWSDPEALRVTISDGGRGFEPVPRVPGQDLGSGWGLFLVDHLADRWGTAPPGRSGVWFEFDRAVNAAEAALSRWTAGEPVV